MWTLHILLLNWTRASSFYCRLIDNGLNWTDNWRRHYGLSSSSDISCILYPLVQLKRNRFVSCVFYWLLRSSLPYFNANNPKHPPSYCIVNALPYFDVAVLQARAFLGVLITLKFGHQCCFPCTKIRYDSSKYTQFIQSARRHPNWVCKRESNNKKKEVLTHFITKL